MRSHSAVTRMAIVTSAAHALLGAKLRGPAATVTHAVTIRLGPTMETVPPRVRRGEAPAAPTVTAPPGSPRGGGVTGPEREHGDAILGGA